MPHLPMDSDQLLHLSWLKCVVCTFHSRQIERYFECFIEIRLNEILCRFEINKQIIIWTRFQWDQQIATFKFVT